MNSTSGQGQPAAGNDALRVLGLQAPGILRSNCAGGSPGKLQKVVWSCSEPAAHDVGADSPAICT